MSNDLSRIDATAQAALVQGGDATPLELVDAAIARIEQVNPQLNAVITPLFEKARAAARETGSLGAGPFRGVPFLLKDLVCHSAGDPFHMGMRFLKDLGWVEAEDTFLAARLREAGFVFLGKTNVPELGPLPTTEPEAYGPTRNPWNTTRSSGGSSGGSAAAVASGMVPAAHANDGGGSIRVPASECGLVGLKPTRGRTSLGPDYGETWAGLTAEHVVTRSVRDTAAILDAVAGPMPGDPYFAPTPARPFLAEVGADAGALRVGLLTRTTAPGSGDDVVVDEECVRAVEGAGRLLESLGHRVEDGAPALDAPGRDAMVVVILAGTAADVAGIEQRTGKPVGAGDVEPLIWELATRGREVSAADYVGAVQQLQSYSRTVRSWWEVDGFDLLVTPVLPEPPPPLGTFASTPEDPLAGFLRAGHFVSFTAPFNITGQPAVSLPLHWSADGLPVGVQLVARYGREDVLLRVAAQLEQAQPWAERRPPVHA